MVKYTIYISVAGRTVKRNILQNLTELLEKGFKTLESLLTYL